MIDSVNGVIIPHMRRLKSLISYNVLDNHNLDLFFSPSHILLFVIFTPHLH